MPSDIVERLRGTVDIRVMREAADEIELLRAQHELALQVHNKMADEIERLRKQLYHATVAVDGIREHALEEAAQAAEINNQHWITGIDRAIRALKEKI